MLRPKQEVSPANLEGQKDWLVLGVVGLRFTCGMWQVPPALVCQRVSIYACVCECVCVWVYVYV